MEAQEVAGAETREAQPPIGPQTNTAQTPENVNTTVTAVVIAAAIGRVSATGHAAATPVIVTGHVTGTNHESGKSQGPMVGADAVALRRKISRRSRRPTVTSLTTTRRAPRLR